MNRRTFRCWLLVIATLSSLPLFSQEKQPESFHFLIVKTGDESANPEMAGGFLDDLTTYLTPKLAFLNGTPLKGEITNDPVEGLKLFKELQPTFAFVTPGFYLEKIPESGLTIHPLFQIPRFEKNVERYYLISAKTGPSSLEDLKGKTVRTLLTAESEYLKRVVFPCNFQPERDFTLDAAENMADEVFLMTDDEEPDPEDLPADALLFDEQLLAFFQADEFTWPSLQVLWTSEALPRELIVVTEGILKTEDVVQLTSVLNAMKENTNGLALLKLMETSGFLPVDSERLEKARLKFEGKGKEGNNGNPPD